MAMHHVTREEARRIAGGASAVG